MSIITLRRWSDTDVGRIADIWLGQYPHPHGDADPPPYRDATERMTRWLGLRQRQRNAIGYVAEVGDDFAGFVVGRITTWESEPPILKPRRAAVIDALFVEGPFRRTGLGSKLVNRVIDRCRKSGIHTIEVGIEPDSGAAGALWKRLGFVPYLISARLRAEA
jgi:GNAT superfamily N-acetyltransferase